LKADCKCVIDRPSKPPAEQNIRVRLEKQGRGGKAVTVAVGFALSAADLEKLAKELKSGLACGGTAAEGTIELQGDQRERAVALLLKKGYPAKKAGG
jgi:translation initiation factor 1